MSYRKHGNAGLFWNEFMVLTTDLRGIVDFYEFGPGVSSVPAMSAQGGWLAKNICAVREADTENAFVMLDVDPSSFRDPMEFRSDLLQRIAKACGFEQVRHLAKVNRPAVLGGCNTMDHAHNEPHQELADCKDWLPVSARPKPTCGHHVTEGVRCGLPAIGAVKLKTGNFAVQAREGETLGRGTGSLWLPICQMHRTSYADYDGLEFRSYSPSGALEE